MKSQNKGSRKGNGLGKYVRGGGFVEEGGVSGEIVGRGGL